MKITLLGTGTSQGVPIVGCTCDVCLSADRRDKRFRTSAFVEVGEEKFLIDAGPDLRMQLLANNITEITAVLITHEHKDHLAGLDDVRPINFRMKHTMPIYGLLRVLNVVKKDYDYAFKTVKYPGVPDLAVVPVYDEPFYVHDVKIEPIHVKHLTLPILGYRIGNLAYITDASFISEKEMQKLQNLDLLVLNALRIREHYSHFNLSQALQVIDSLRPKKAVLTHISHEMGKYADVSKLLPENVILGYDGLVIEMVE
ncbi:MAG: MBL fold metallo-hydrolase [Bacteroidales bacterium]|nr:MBL fold metallo-hydrolase [Bacteroidales bacterium]